jgi:glycosyltransferase involved in cell wall biosynthesis
MRSEPAVTLVGPYEGDGCGSIERFVRCLARELKGRMPIRLIAPRRVLARFAPGASSAAKWLGYLDKFLWFPRQLSRACAGSDLIHFSDQSCAIYATNGPRLPQLLTCTDLLAIRSAAGEFPEHRTRWTGRQLQRLIVRGIERVDYVACISRSTRRDLLRLASVREENASFIPMGLHGPFQPVSAETARRVLSRIGVKEPFLLHVGGNQWYKNRRGVLEIYRHVLQSSPAAPKLLLVGKPPSPGLAILLRDESLREKVQCVSGCSDTDLAALYSAARLLLFPSLYEGFGWPIIEAQACGCPVVTTQREPMSEVGGAGARYIDPTNLEASASAVLGLLSETAAERAARVAAGSENAARYSTETMIGTYLQTYRAMARARAPQRSVALFPA